MRTDELFEVILAGEGQTVEFKESLSSGAKREAIQTMVAFANAEGGRVFFGVRNDTTAKGVQIGNDTLERLANLVRDHTYPSLPFTIDDAFTYGGKTVLSVDVPRDTPRVVGVYLYSEKAIIAQEPIDAAKLQAYRRIGRTNQKEDFMRLRQSLPSDPRVRIEMQSAGLYTDNPAAGNAVARAWTEEGSATAHSLVMRLEPVSRDSDEMANDLPFPGKNGFVNLKRFEFNSMDVRLMLEAREVCAFYRDDWLLMWKVSRRIEPVMAESGRYIEFRDQGSFARRITEFPPKSGVPE